MDGHPILFDLSMEARTRSCWKMIFLLQWWDFQVPSVSFWWYSLNPMNCFRNECLKKSQKFKNQTVFFFSRLFDQVRWRWESTPPPWSSCERHRAMRMLVCWILQKEGCQLFIGKDIQTLLLTFKQTQFLSCKPLLFMILDVRFHGASESLSFWASLNDWSSNSGEI